MVRHLLSIEIEYGTNVWNRTLLYDSIPTVDELKEYYCLLCGLTDAKITIKSERVSASFNEGLLHNGEIAPTIFPFRDLESKTDDTEKRLHYKKYIRQLCDMEVSRAKLETYKQTEGADDTATEEQDVIKRTKASIIRTREWVKDLLRSLNPDEDDESLVAIVIDENIPLGWVFTPVVNDMRENVGSRVITNTELGKKWEGLLGTDLYPDLVVSRRITPANWLFQHVASEAVVKATLEWYIVSQNSKAKDGISEWIVRADSDLNTLFKPFKQIRIHEKYLTESSEMAANKHEIFKILGAFESKCIASSLTDSTISPISLEVFQHYMKYLFRGYGHAYETYKGMESVSRLFVRWTRGSYGFRAGVDPLLDTWKDLWHIIMRGNPSAERVQLFLVTLDCWDPILLQSIPEGARSDIAKKWMHVYFDNELIVETKHIIRSVFLYEQMRQWCFKFIPEAMFDKKFNPTQIAPLLNLRGHASSKRNSGRFTLSLRFRDRTIVDPTLQNMKKMRMPDYDLVEANVLTEHEMELKAEKEAEKRAQENEALRTADDLRKDQEEAEKKREEELESKRVYSRQWRKDNRTGTKEAIVAAGLDVSEALPKYVRKVPLKEPLTSKAKPKPNMDISVTCENTIDLGLV